MEKTHVFNGYRDDHDADLFLSGACKKHCSAIGVKPSSLENRDLKCV